MRALADATPATRDRFVDFVRAASILVVVTGHWAGAIISWNDGRITLHGAIGITRGLWLITWLLQVMPLFFFVGGFSNSVALRSVARRGEPVSHFLRARLERLGIPTLVFAGVWIAVELLLHLLDVGSDGVIRVFEISNIPFGPLWFLAVYLVVTLASPVTLRLHERFGVRVPIVLGAVAIAADSIAFGAHVEPARWINLAAVWFLVHQLGYFYGDGSLLRAGPRAWGTMAVAGLVGLIVLTNIGVYPRSMLGTDASFFHLKPIEQVSNMSPPTICIVALTLWQIGLTMFARAPVSRWLEHARPWRATVAANTVVMTVYLWHLTAYAVAIVLLYPLGFGHELDTSARWWLERILWELVPGAILVGLVVLFGRFEQPRRR